MRGNQGFRCEGYVAHGEGLFLKRPDTVTDSIQLKKLAFIATVFGQFEGAQQCFEPKEFEIALQPQNIAPDPQSRYLDFISRLARTVDLPPQRSSPLFSDVYSFAQSDARFQTQTDSAGGVRRFLKTFTFLVTAVRFWRSILHDLNNIYQSIYARRIPIMLSCGWWPRHSGPTVEALFAEFGMKDQYRLAMRNSIIDFLVQPSSKKS